MVQARQGSGRMVAGLAPVVAVLVLISAVIDVYRVLQRCVRPSRGPPRPSGSLSSYGVRGRRRLARSPKCIVCTLQGYKLPL